MGNKHKADVRKPEILAHFYEVFIKEGLEGASIAKIAKHMDVHPSLLIHYFKTKENMTVELVDFVINRYESIFLEEFDDLQDPEQRFNLIIDILFGADWSEAVDNSVFYAFYYLSYRNSRVRERFEGMFKRLRNMMITEFKSLKEQGVISVKDHEKAVDLVITLIEGLEFHASFLSDGQPFEVFSMYVKEVVVKLLKGGEV